MKSGLERLKEIVTQSAFYRSPNYSVNVSFKEALLRNSDEKPNLLKLSDFYTIY